MRVLSGNQEERAPLAETLTGLQHEGARRVVAMALLFAVIGLAALAVGWNWPKKYYAVSTILVAEDKTIQKLMEGRAVTTGVAERAMIAREVIFSPAVMKEVLQLGGWLDDAPDAARIELLSEAIQRRTVLGTPRENLIRIEYWDEQPERAAQVAQHFADSFMRYSHDAQLSESSEAVAFILDQVNLYEAQLAASESALARYRAAHPAARAEPVSLIEGRIGQLRRQIELDRSSLQTAALGALAEGAVSSGANAGPLQRRISAMQDDLVGLRLQYTDAHPNVLRAQRQLAELQQLGRLAPDPSSRSIPAGSGRRAASRADAAALTARIGANEQAIEAELERVRSLSDPAAELAQLLRARDVARDLVQDLLRRLEYARLSMRLDEQGRGLHFRTQEPAAVPTQARGWRFAHFVVGGLAVATAAPFGLLFALVHIDPHLRSAAALQRQTGLTVLASLPTYRDRADRRRRTRQWRVALTIVVLVLLMFALAGGWKLAASA